MTQVLRSSSLDTLRDALTALSERSADGAPSAVTLAQTAILAGAITTYESCLSATQAPSPGIDSPPGIFFGQPDRAHANAAHHVRLQVALAEALLADG